MLGRDMNIFYQQLHDIFVEIANLFRVTLHYVACSSAEREAASLA
jgi:hypothetical protein